MTDNGRFSGLEIDGVEPPSPPEPDPKDVKILELTAQVAKLEAEKQYILNQQLMREAPSYRVGNQGDLHDALAILLMKGGGNVRLSKYDLMQAKNIDLRIEPDFLYDGFMLTARPRPQRYSGISSRNDYFLENPLTYGLDMAAPEKPKTKKKT